MYITQSNQPMNPLSDRVKFLTESATLAMTRLSRELTAQGLDVINLSIGEPDFDTPSFVKEAAKKAIDDNWTHYPPVPGYQDLREAVSQKLKRDNNLDYSPEQIVVSTGAKQALTNVMLSLVNPGDEVIVPTPFWVSYSELIKLAEGKAVYINATLENRFKITPQQLEQAITPKTRLVMFNSPNNPTGSVYSLQELQEIAKVLENHPHVYVIADEIYEYITFGVNHHSLASFDSIKERIIIINGVSKGYAMTGWRLGYSVSSLEIAKACNKIQGQVTSGTCSITQRAALAALQKGPNENPELVNMVETFRKRRDLLGALLKEIPGFKVDIPDGAFYIFPDISDLYGKKMANGSVISNDDELCMYLLKEAHVALVSGSSFGNPNCIRFSYATSDERLIEAVKRIKKALL